MRPRTVTLTEEERAALVRVRDRDPRPYLREKAKAVLLVADGARVPGLCDGRVLSTRRRETVYGWLSEFERHRLPQPHPARRRRLSPPG